MVRRDLFTFRLSKTEAQMLGELSARLERSKSDSLRLLIREAAASLAESDGQREKRPAAGVNDARAT